MHFKSLHFSFQVVAFSKHVWRHTKQNHVNVGVGKTAIFAHNNTIERKFGEFCQYIYRI